MKAFFNFLTRSIRVKLALLVLLGNAILLHFIQYGNLATQIKAIIVYALNYFRVSSVPLLQLKACYPHEELALWLSSLSSRPLDEIKLESSMSSSFDSALGRLSKVTTKGAPVTPLLCYDRGT